MLSSPFSLSSSLSFFSFSFLSASSFPTLTPLYTSCFTSLYYPFLAISASLSPFPPPLHTYPRHPTPLFFSISLRHLFFSFLSLYHRFSRYDYQKVRNGPSPSYRSLLAALPLQVRSAFFFPLCILF